MLLGGAKRPGSFTTPKLPDSPHRPQSGSWRRFWVPPAILSAVRQAPQRAGLRRRAVAVHQLHRPRRAPSGKKTRSFMDALTYSPLSNSCPCGFSYFGAATPKRRSRETPPAQSPRQISKSEERYDGSRKPMAMPKTRLAGCDRALGLGRARKTLE